MTKVADVIQAAEERLQSAQFGLEDMRTRPARRQSGLRNAVVFGRMVTFALQNMKNIVPEFDEWYAAKQEKMKADPLMKYFSDLRTEIEKTAKRHTGSITHIESISGSDMRRFMPAPPGATSFFIGDSNGGTGWEVKRADGSVEKYYVELPPDIGEVRLILANAPTEFSGEPAEKLVDMYLKQLGELVAEAKKRFL